MTVVFRRIVPVLVILVILVTSCQREGEESETAKPLARPDDRIAALEARRARGTAEERGAVTAELALLYLNRRQNERALANAQEAQRLGVVTSDVLYVAGEALRRKFDSAQARELLERVLTNKPAHAGAQRSMAHLLTREGEFEDAVALWDAQIAAGGLGPDELQGLLDYGRSLRGAGRRQEAADCFAKLLEADPSEAVAYSELAQTLYRMRLRREARFIEGIFQEVSKNAFEEHVGEKLADSGRVLFALGQRAFLRASEGRFLEALSDYQEALTLEEKDSRISIHYADLCARLSRSSDASAALDAALRSGAEPSSGLFWTRARFALTTAGDEAAGARAARSDLEEARRALRSEGDRGGGEKGQAPVFGLTIADVRVMLETERLDDALALSARLEKLAPSRWESAYWRGRVALRRQEFAAALTAFEEAARRSPNVVSAGLAYWHGNALERLKRPAEALRQYQTALRLRPGDARTLEAIVGLLPENSADLSPARSALEAARTREARERDLEGEIDRTPLSQCGTLYLELGKLAVGTSLSRAVDMLLLASDLLPDNSEVRSLLLRYLRQPRDTFRRIGLLRRLLEIDPQNVNAALTLAGLEVQIHVHLGEAEELARRVHSTRPSPISYRLLAEVLLRLGRAQDAVNLLEEGAPKHANDEALRDALERARSAAE